MAKKSFMKNGEEHIATLSSYDESRQGLFRIFMKCGGVDFWEEDCPEKRDMKDLFPEQIGQYLHIVKMPLIGPVPSLPMISEYEPDKDEKYCDKILESVIKMEPLERAKITNFCPSDCEPSYGWTCTGVYDVYGRTIPIINFAYFGNMAGKIVRGWETGPDCLLVREIIDWQGQSVVQERKLDLKFRTIGSIMNYSKIR